jgi:hypothetical protein
LALLARRIPGALAPTLSVPSGLPFADGVIIVLGAAPQHGRTLALPAADSQGNHLTNFAYMQIHPPARPKRRRVFIPFVGIDFSDQPACPNRRQLLDVGIDQRATDAALRPIRPRRWGLYRAKPRPLRGFWFGEGRKI